MLARKFVSLIFISVVTSLGSVMVYDWYRKDDTSYQSSPKQVSQVAHLASYETGQSGGLPDLTYAAGIAVHAVVHVKTTAQMSNTSPNSVYDFFFGPGYSTPQVPMEATGSGVIISSDGYIVTNNHVIKGAKDIEITLNDKRLFKATLVGADPTSDVALLKIDGNNFPSLALGNSDALKVGEWVLAVGNPFNLTSTVTAGIVSAKARSINIIANGNQPLGIESFIQTDAAVNPGNSGGALVNQKGELVGINTAIASQTGSYTGYSFAVPVTIAKKVVADLKEFGTVQRALLGVTITEVNEKVAKELGVSLDKIEGVFVVNLSEGGAAQAAGLKPKDIIVSVDGEPVNTVPELQERISVLRPGDKVELIVKRDKKKKPYTITLRNSAGTTSVISSQNTVSNLGATFEPISQSEKNRLNINSGIKIVSLIDGKLKASGVEVGYIIVKANREEVNSVDDFNRIVNSVDDGLLLSGIYPNGRVIYYAVDVD